MVFLHPSRVSTCSVIKKWLRPSHHSFRVQAAAAPAWTRCLSTTTTTTTNRMKNDRASSHLDQASRSYHSTASTAVNVSGLERLGLGGRVPDDTGLEQYQDIVQAALLGGVTTFQAPPQADYCRALMEVVSGMHDNGLLPHTPIHLITRMGYRTQSMEAENAAANDNEETPLKAKTVWRHDVVVPEAPREDSDDEKPPMRVVHNIATTAVQEALQAFSEHQELRQKGVLSWTLLLHNPEVQMAGLNDESESVNDDEHKQRQQYVQDRLVDGISALEKAVADNRLDAWGICSNGLSLPTAHPMHLNWSNTIVPALERVKQEGDLSNLHMSVVELPANVLEPNGLTVARQVHADVIKMQDDFVTPPQVYAMRPLTCYPDGGIANTSPYVLADYQLPTSLDQADGMQWSYQMQEPPQVYQVALKHAMAHFDAEEILEKKTAGTEELTCDERETLDGCKLMQSLLHDVDNGLQDLTCFRVHERYLRDTVIPLIHDTFESYDDDTAAVLQSFFGAYSLAVRHAIAQNTRKVLLEKGDVNESELESKTLQEFGLEFLLREPAIGKVMVGCSQPSQIEENVELVPAIVKRLKEAQEAAAASDSTSD